MEWALIREVLRNPCDRALSGPCLGLRKLLLKLSCPEARDRGPCPKAPCNCMVYTHIGLEGVAISYATMEARQLRSILRIMGPCSSGT